MTGQLVVDITGGGAGTLGLKVINTLSGAIIHAEKSLSSSGSLYVENLISIGGDDNSAQNPYLDVRRSSTGIDGMFRFFTTNSEIWRFGMRNDGTNSFRFQDGSTNVVTIEDGGRSNALYIANTNHVGTVGIGTADPKATLEVIGSISGARLTISNNANISGSLVVLNNIVARGNLSGSTLTVSSSASISGSLLVKNSITSKGSLSGVTIAGFNLGSCNSVSQKLLYNYSTQKFECGTDRSGTNTGNILQIGDARYVKKSGDTMTGALNVRATLSGSRLVIDGNANVSGALLVKGNITSRGTISGALITQNGAGNNYFLGNLGIGVTTPGSKLSLAAPAGSNTVEFGFYNDAGATKIGSIGTNNQLKLVLDGYSTNGVYMPTGLSLGTYASGAPPTGGAIISGNVGIGTNNPLSLLQVGTNGFSVSDISASGELPAGSNIAARNSNTVITTDYLGTVGDKLTLGYYNGSAWKSAFEVANTSGTPGALLLMKSGGTVGIGTSAAKAQLDVIGTISGSRLSISNNANISGTLLVLNNITTRGTLSGYNLTVSRSASISGTLIVKTGITSKGSVSGSTILGFGLGSCNGATQKLVR
jgi:cytoskeletal protein CcmA (bactofilin family)